MGRYVEALLAETERRIKETAYTVPSVYIGGGTPSLLGAKGITRLLKGITALTGAGHREITVEANPETADEYFLRSCAGHGVTRLSLGVQSFDEGERKAAGRRGCPQDVLLRRLSKAAEIFGPFLSLDLMSGLPGQDEDMLLRNIGKAIFFGAGHISLYALTPAIPPVETSDRLWLTGRDALKNAGYEHYEVSSFALGNVYRCVHNIRYWSMQNWIGTGPSASGTIIDHNGTGRRISYAPDTKVFVSAVKNRIIPPLTIEELDRKTVLKETILMGYRCREGPDHALFFRRFGKSIQETIPQTLLKWQNRAGDVPMHEKIMNYLNAFLLDAYSELDNS